MPNLFQLMEFSLSKFDSFDPTYQTKAEFRYLGKELVFFISLLVVCQRKHLFSPILGSKPLLSFLFSPNKKKRSKSTRQADFFKPKIFHRILDFFKEFFSILKSNKWVKEERGLGLEDRIWKLKFGEMQFEVW